MKLKFKKAVAAMLSITFLCSTMAPSINSIKLVKPALIADAAGSCTSFDEATGTLTLSGNVVKEEVQAWAGNLNVKKVTCAEGTVLPADCSYLFRRIDGRYTAYFYAEELDFSNADTSRVTNMQCMFLGCINLRNINLTDFDTSNVTNMSNMFAACKKLEYVDLTGFDTKNVTDMSSMFLACNSLKELDLSSFDTSNVQQMGSMFCDCENIEYLDLKTFNFENVTSMEYMFTNCFKLEHIDFDNEIDTSKVTNMSSMFHGCLELQSLDLRNFDTGNVTNMEDMFGGIGLTDLDVSSFDTSSVTRMYAMFCGCPNLKSIYGLDHFDTSNVEDMHWMFYCSELLESLDLSSFDTSNVTNMNLMFGQCKSIRELDLSTFDTSKVSNMRQMFAYCDSLTTIFVSGRWSTESLNTEVRYNDGWEMFIGDIKLVGGNGTCYDPSRTGVEMAHVDTLEAPGYLSSEYQVNIDDIKTGINKYGTSTPSTVWNDNYGITMHLNAGGYFLGEFKINFMGGAYYDIEVDSNKIVFNIYTKNIRGNYQLVTPAEGYDNTYRLEGSKTYYIQAYEPYLFKNDSHIASVRFHLFQHVDRQEGNRIGIWRNKNENISTLIIYVPKDKVEDFEDQVAYDYDTPDEIHKFKIHEDSREWENVALSGAAGGGFGALGGIVTALIGAGSGAGFGLFSSRGNRYKKLISDIHSESHHFENGIQIYLSKWLREYSCSVYEWDGEVMEGKKGSIGTFEIIE